MQTSLARICLFLFFLNRMEAYRFLEEPCGTLPTNFKILYGSNAGQEAAAWMAAISNADKFICGGTLINDRFILTAAHCINGQGNLFVKLGAYNRSLPFAQYNVSHAEMHSSFNSNGIRNYDIGLLKLSESVEYSVSIYPICLIMDKGIKNQVENMWRFQAFGWGKRSDGLASEILQTITMNHLDRAICAGSPNGDTCSGDSGGPLTTNYNGRQTQFGIVSYGTNSCDGPGVYTDVTSFVDWIEDTIRRLNSQPLMNNATIMVYRNCSPNHTESIVTIIEWEIRSKRNRTHPGVVITDRFVLTTASFLDGYTHVQVSLPGYCDIFEVDATIKHSSSFRNARTTRTISLVKLRTPIIGGLRKPICILQKKSLRQLGNEPIQERDPRYRSCMADIKITPNQVCVQSYSRTPEFGNIWTKEVLYNRKTFNVLHGLFNFERRFVNVYEIIEKHVDWIVATINLNL